MLYLALSLTHTHSLQMVACTSFMSMFSCTDYYAYVNVYTSIVASLKVIHFVAFIPYVDVLLRVEVLL